MDYSTLSLIIAFISAIFTGLNFYRNSPKVDVIWCDKLEKIEIQKLSLTDPTVPYRFTHFKYAYRVKVKIINSKHVDVGFFDFFAHSGKDECLIMMRDSITPPYRKCDLVLNHGNCQELLSMPTNQYGILKAHTAYSYDLIVTPPVDKTFNDTIKISFSLATNPLIYAITGIEVYTRYQQTFNITDCTK